MWPGLLRNMTNARMAYSYLRHYECICLCSITLIASSFMPDYYLGKQQNADNNKGLGGEIVDMPDQYENAEKRPGSVSLWQKLLALYRKKIFISQAPLPLKNTYVS